MLDNGRNETKEGRKEGGRKRKRKREREREERREKREAFFLPVFFFPSFFFFKNQKIKILILCSITYYYYSVSS